MAELSISELHSPIGLIAGNGDFPVEFLKNAHKNKLEVVVVAHRNETDPLVEKLATRCIWIKIGEVKKMLRTLKKAGVKEAAFAGGIRRINIFKNTKLDLKALAIIARVGSIRDDVILRAVADEVEKAGIHVFSPGVLLDKSLARAGVLTRRSLTPDEVRDAKVGWTAALTIGQLDIGQTIIVSDGVVAAVEAMEGTDQAILRAGSLTNGRGGVVVKLAKPQQDLRLDLPAVGVGTIQSMIEAKLTALIIQHERALILKPQEVVSLADAHKIAILVQPADFALNDHVVE